MKSFQMLGACVFALLLSCAVGMGAPVDSGSTSNEVWSVFQRYVNEKHALEKSLAKKHEAELPPFVEEFFVAEQKGDWIASSNRFWEIAHDLATRNPDHKSTRFEPWEPIHDSYGALEIVHGMNPKFVKMFGEGIVKDVPPGSIYFGGNDPGYFLVAAFSESQTEGRPFFIISQNRLTDPSYVFYVADTFGNKINFIGTNDEDGAYQTYMADWQQRSLHDKNSPNEPRQVMPGEDTDLDESGKVRVNSHIGIMAVNGLLSKTVFDKNPNKKFYVSESFPLDWMFPHLTPAGLVMKVNRAEVPELSEDILKQDHEYWAKYSGQLVGDWITYDTPVKEITAFVEKVFLQKDFSGFKGDPDFIRDAAAQKAFSKMRSSIAGVYSFRLGQPPSGGKMPTQYVATGANRKLIEREADFAFKQAVALCPTSAEAIYRYVQFLVNAGRVNDALLIAETGRKLDPENTQFEYLIKNLQSIKGQNSSKADIQAEIATLEKTVDANPTNLVQCFALAQKYVQAGENEKAYKVLDRVMAFSDLTVPEVLAVADAFNKLNQPKRLDAALEKLTELAPDSPEAWYDLAASRAMLGRNEPAFEALKKSLDLNDKRLAQNSKTNDVRLSLGKDPRFSKLREMEEFKTLVGKP
jgi:tetratricopeptide (TPR) repeat protein